MLGGFIMGTCWGGRTGCQRSSITKRLERSITTVPNNRRLCFDHKRLEEASTGVVFLVGIQMVLEPLLQVEVLNQGEGIEHTAAEVLDCNEGLRSIDQVWQGET